MIELKARQRLIIGGNLYPAGSRFAVAGEGEADYFVHVLGTAEYVPDGDAPAAEESTDSSEHLNKREVPVSKEHRKPGRPKGSKSRR